MRQFLDRASMSFAAGAFGALANSVAIWAAGAITSPHAFGFLFMLPLRGHWWLRGTPARLPTKHRPDPTSVRETAGLAAHLLS
jgi:hypothetical protein